MKKGCDISGDSAGDLEFELVNMDFYIDFIMYLLTYQFVNIVFNDIICYLLAYLPF